MCPLRLWIVTCSVLVSWGWFLSLFHGLYGFSYIPVVAALVYFEFKIASGKNFEKIIGRSLSRLFTIRMFLTGVFTLSTILLLFKGLLNGPSHDDGLCYRIPMAMQWIMHQGWIWAPWQDMRINMGGTTSAWLSVPLLIWFKSDRTVFLSNWVCQLFFPGLIFSFWRGMGVSGRICWYLMWLLPSAFCFMLQAANTSNDTLGTFFVLAAFYYALKARRNPCWESVALSILSIGLATNVKLNFAVLGFPWLFAIFPQLRVLLGRPLFSIGLVALAISSSFFPESIICWYHGAGFTGLGFNKSVVAPPFPFSIVGNTFMIILQNIWPPLIMGMTFGSNLSSAISNSNLGYIMDRYFMSGWNIHYQIVPVEQAGLGLPVIIGLIVLWMYTKRTNAIQTPGFNNLVLGGIGCGLLHFMMFSNSDQEARLICPYYVLLLPALFLRRVLKTKLFRFADRACTVSSLISAILCLTISEGSIAFTGLNDRANEDDSASALLAQLVPAKEGVIGMIRVWCDREAWAWRPYGSRVVIEFSTQASAAEMESYGVHYVVIFQDQLDIDKVDYAKWLKDHQATEVCKSDNTGGKLWYCVRIADPHSAGK